MEQEYREEAEEQQAQGRPADEPDLLAPACGSTAPPAASGCGCRAGHGCCGGRSASETAGGAVVEPSYVYVLGQIDFRIPSLGVEKEIAQNMARSDTRERTDRQAVRSVLAQRENRYLARQLCYVLSVQGIETYILRPRDPLDFDLLVEAVRAEPRASDLDVVIGLRGSLAPPGLCNGLTLPVVGVDQIYSFDSGDLVRAIERPERISAEQFEPASHELLRRIMQLGDNAGDTDEHRALNYLAVRYPRIYEKTVEAYADDSSLSAVGFCESRLSGTRRIIDVLLSFTGRRTDVTEKFFVRVDVTEEFPFLVTKLSPYYDR
ncbi:hypothetical protein OG689_19550 [Kitasatospora sp. NBC_00240]|uniref:cyanobactin maturation protease PatG family protein n=1 Tax=Kitasatospora sp. NBC_00240 TaxID=2903567 RepID=UPI00225297F6|nr:hypothetical protein [Kitasatospora sp. NBC_00240]MCX5211457.1 hypothetical protein [Kitasatospora sp. NBC_00240]